jgi:inner membrane protein
MPSPVGHALGGLIAGWAIAGAPDVRTTHWREDVRTAVRASAPFALLAVAPDLDLLVHLHSRYTHSLGAAAIVTLVAAAFAPPRRRAVFALACGAACASHVLLDWLGSDTSPPLGIMALWPFSSDFYLSDRGWFLATDRRYWLPGFMARNLYALLWELILLAPPAALTWWLRRRRVGLHPAQASDRATRRASDRAADQA